MYHIPTRTMGNLFILPRPRGSDWLPRDVRAWKQAGIQRVISTLTSSEESELELTDESRVANEQDLEFESLPIVDRSTPDSSESFDRLTESLADRLIKGESLGIHCRQGIGRSGLIAIRTLQWLGDPLDEAVRKVSMARGLNIPETPEQLNWLKKLSVPNVVS